MKITGLVRVFNQVRAQLQAGLTPDEVAPFKRLVLDTLREVEAICRRHGVTIEHLPAPSRRAYVFLRELDLARLPLREHAAPATAPAGFRVKNVVKNGEYYADRLWSRLEALLVAPNAAEARAQLADQLAQQAAAIEQLCARHGQTPAALEAPSRRVYCWLKSLAAAESLTAHLAALQRAREMAGRHTALVAALNGRAFRLQLLNLNALWRRREYRDAVLLKVHQGFGQAEPEVWKALLHCALSRRTPAREQVFREYAESEEFSAALFELESFAAPPAAPMRGRAHDLAASFARVNAAYFGWQMPQPALVWNRTLTARKFAHYQPSRDTVMISVTLDDPAVPAHLLDFVMYHELLHKKHGSLFVNGRRLVHGPAFRAEERLFVGYAEAERQLNALARQQQAAGGLSFDGELEEGDE